MSSRRTPPLGPRIIFKAGDLGAFAYAEVFEPSPAAMLRAFALEAPPTKGGVIVVTEVWRKAKRPGDAHTDLRAIDLGTETAGKLSFTDAELDEITAATLRIGRNDGSLRGCCAHFSSLCYGYDSAQ